MISLDSNLKFQSDNLAIEIQTTYEEISLRFKDWNSFVFSPHQKGFRVGSAFKAIKMSSELSQKVSLYINNDRIISLNRGSLKIHSWSTFFKVVYITLIK
jgi:hypothetical protein